MQTLEKLMAAPTLTDEARYFLTTLRLAFSEKGADSMITSMTEEEILDFGKKLTHMSLRYASYKDRLEGIPAQERMRDIPVEERLEGVSKDELLKILTRLTQSES